MKINMLDITEEAREKAFRAMIEDTKSKNSGRFTAYDIKAMKSTNPIHGNVNNLSYISKCYKFITIRKNT